ncbi:hypothetical protein Ccrd_016473 [Cynara cardunculus var. scolymus]|uniref:SNRNP25 ubiquitin-like domain-containing protein n=1 Tax=Cynara cardunculus var. scolymus TaxID=59895 RepID=A0A103Y9T9_CYNCS|nr:hypothetical protein Ccrd_016473 [Cynara cardunculus var. scolymus]
MVFYYRRSYLYKNIRRHCTEPTSSGVKEDDNLALEYNSNNVKKAKLNSTLAALLDDPVLADVPKKPTLSDVDTLISLELGSAMRVSVLKLDNTSFDVALMNSATVKDLKLAIKKKINEMEQSKMGHRHISWFVPLRSMCGETSASHITMKSSLTMMQSFKIMACVITPRCILSHMSCQGLQSGIHEEESIDFFMVSTEGNEISNP